MLGIDYVSPLPPVRSGIADYSADLLPELAKRCDLRLVHLPGQELGAEWAECCTTVGPAQLGDDGRLPLYQMGNNHHHQAVWGLAMERPGVLTLHDLVLHHFLIDRTVKGGDYDGYRAQLVADHGWLGEAAARPMAWPGGSGAAAQFALPAHRTLLARQRGVLVHSGWAADRLREEIPGLRVQDLAMGIPLPPAMDAAAGRDFRALEGLPLDAPILGSFGFQTPIKRTDVVIRALARPELAGVHLMVAGEVAPILRLEEEAAALGVTDRLHVLGFLPFEKFEAAIAASDLCLNLRYPTAGETSASLLRILAVGKPAIVSDHAQSAELPDAGLIKVPLGEGEDEVLAQRLRSLLDDPESLERMGAAARQHIETHHRLAAAAEAVLDACSAWQDATPLSRGEAVVPVDPPPPTTLVWDDLPGELEVSGAETPWPEGERRELVIELHNRSIARWLAAERGDGGIALEISLERGAADGVPASSDEGASPGRWLGLPRDLEPGESHRFTYRVRRPPGSVRLSIRPHVLGRLSLSGLGGPVWDADI